MFDKNTIAQLSQLKKEIISSKDYADGVVMGSNGRFGFLKTDDGRTAFINPDRMQHLLPGDRIKANLIVNNKNKLEAETEQLLEVGTKRFLGNYKIKGNNHFVQNQNDPGSRWLFLPPKFRKKCKDGDLVSAELLKHPFNDGQSSAKIVSVLGAESDDFITHKRVIAEYDLDQHWPADIDKQAEAIQSSMHFEQWPDQTSLPLVTIDSPSTRDMDDAIYGQAEEDGSFTLFVAIASPGQFINPGSAVAKSARAIGQSVYLPCRTIPMLPEILSTDSFSLRAGQIKPCILIQISISASGEISNYQFSQAKICSKHKLSYSEVSDYLQGNPEDVQTQLGEDTSTSLFALKEIAKIRRAYRVANHLVGDDLDDFDFRLDKHGLISEIVRREKTLAHKLVEESMIATNLCAGQFFADNQSGLFTTQTGFRDERIGEVRAVLKEELAEDVDLQSINEFAPHLNLIKKLQSEHKNLLPALRRMMQSSELSVTAAPHMNMGVKHYATISSPIRRYADLSNHWSLIQILNQQKPQQMSEKGLELLKERINNNRVASRHLELSLVGRYIQNEFISKNKSLEGKAIVRIVTQQGFGVRLVDSGIEGFIQVPKKIEKVFDAKRMTLTVAGICYAIEREVDVKVVAVELEKRRVKMELKDGFESGDTPE